MHLEKHFDVSAPPERVVERIACDETLTTLFADSPTEIVASEGNRRTTRTRYRALGREGEATFHFSFGADGRVEFEKVCDGRVWRRLVGTVSLRPRGDGTRVLIEMDGSTKSLVPEFTIRGAMQEQIEEMAAALRARIEAA